MPEAHKNTTVHFILFILKFFIISFNFRLEEANGDL